MNIHDIHEYNYRKYLMFLYKLLFVIAFKNDARRKEWIIITCELVG